MDAGEVLDIMFTDFPAKYEEYRQHLRETRDTRTANKPPPQLTTERSKQVCSHRTWYFMYAETKPYFFHRKPSRELFNRLRRGTLDSTDREEQWERPPWIFRRWRFTGLVNLRPWWIRRRPYRITRSLFCPDSTPIIIDITLPMNLGILNFKKVMISLPVFLSIRFVQIFPSQHCSKWHPKSVQSRRRRRFAFRRVCGRFGSDR